MTIPEYIYTVSDNQGDLTIHEWKFQDSANAIPFASVSDMLVYYNQATDSITKLEYYDNEEDFFIENDVFESQFEALSYMMGIEFIIEEEEGIPLDQAIDEFFGLGDDDEFES